MRGSVVRIRRARNPPLSAQLCRELIGSESSWQAREACRSTADEPGEVLPGTSAPCSGNLNACYARSAAALMPAASPSHSAGTMARSTVMPRRPARFPSPCAGPARIPPQLHRSFERGFKSSLSFFLSCPSKCRISNEFACFRPTPHGQSATRVIFL